MKKLIAYSSVAHMGFVTMGIFAGTTQGVQGAIFQMLSHGIVSGALFLCVGVVYDRMHTREIAAYGGLVNRMPLYAAVFMVFTMANVGLPGTIGLRRRVPDAARHASSVNTWVAFFATLGVILSAAYALWLYRRVIFGELDKPSARRASSISTAREIADPRAAGRADASSSASTRRRSSTSSAASVDRRCSTTTRQAHRRRRKPPRCAHEGDAMHRRSTSPSLARSCRSSILARRRAGAADGRRACAATAPTAPITALAVVLLVVAGVADRCWLPATGASPSTAASSSTAFARFMKLLVLIGSVVAIAACRSTSAATPSSRPVRVPDPDPARDRSA